MKYGAILADPPWHFKSWSIKGEGRSASRHYQTKETASIGDDFSSMVNEWADDNCALFMWAVDSMLPDALTVMSKWGFIFKTVAFTWVKADNSDGVWSREHFGMGYWTRANPEICLLGTRGNPKRLSAKVRQLVVEPRRDHSRKPDCIKQRIQELVSGPYLEMFARESVLGWDAWGNEVDKFTSKTQVE